MLNTMNNIIRKRKMSTRRRFIVNRYFSLSTGPIAVQIDLVFNERYKEYIIGVECDYYERNISIQIK